MSTRHIIYHTDCPARTRVLIPNLRRIISHADCPDGIVAAFVAMYAHRLTPEDVLFVHHDSPAHRALQPGEAGGVDVFVDMLPWFERKEQDKGEPSDAGWERIRAWVDAGAWVIDHHAGAQIITSAFSDRGHGTFGENARGESGAVLAARAFLRAGEAIDLVALAEAIGVRDTWQRQDPSFAHASAISAAVAAIGFDGLVKRFGRHTIDVNVLADIGDALSTLAARRAKACLGEAHLMSVEGLRVLAFENDGKDISNVSDLATEVDLVATWHLFHEARMGAASCTRMRVSLRSRSGFNCAALAKHHGGGGHVSAAGFTVDVDDGPPPAHLARLIRLYLWSKSARPAERAQPPVRDGHFRWTGKGGVQPWLDQINEAANDELRAEFSRREASNGALVFFDMADHEAGLCGDTLSPETVALLKQHLGASFAIHFDW